MALLTCRLILALDTKDEALRKLRKLTKGWRCENVAVHPYWKLAGSFDVNFVIQLPTGTLQELVFETVRFASSMAESPWSLHGPHVRGVGPRFRCTLTAIDSAQVVRWACLELDDDVNDKADLASLEVS